MLYAEMQQVVIHINPQRVHERLTPPPFKALQRLLLPVDMLGISRLLPPTSTWRYIFGGNWERQAVDFRQSKSYRMMSDLVANRADYRQSLVYQRAIAKVQAGKPYHHKEHWAHDEAGVVRIFDTVLMPLIESMATQGYIQKPDADMPEFLISRSGQLIKCRRGRHRFATARLVGVDKGYPCIINTIHRDWWQEHVVRPGGNRLARFRQAMGKLEAQHQ